MQEKINNSSLRIISKNKNLYNNKTNVFNVINDFKSNCLVHFLQKFGTNALYHIFNAFLLFFTTIESFL
jgi:hypothetical protein